MMTMVPIIILMLSMMIILIMLITMLVTWSMPLALCIEMLRLIIVVAILCFFTCRILTGGSCGDINNNNNDNCPNREIPVRVVDVVAAPSIVWMSSAIGDLPGPFAYHESIGDLNSTVSAADLSDSEDRSASFEFQWERDGHGRFLDFSELEISDEFSNDYHENSDSGDNSKTE